MSGTIFTAVKPNKQTIIPRKPQLRCLSDVLGKCVQEDIQMYLSAY